MGTEFIEPMQQRMARALVDLTHPTESVERFAAHRQRADAIAAHAEPYPPPISPDPFPPLEMVSTPEMSPHDSDEFNGGVVLTRTMSI